MWWRLVVPLLGAGLVWLGVRLVSSSLYYDYDSMGWSPSWFQLGWSLVIVGAGWVAWPLASTLVEEFQGWRVLDVLALHRIPVPVDVVLFVVGFAAVWLGVGAAVDGVAVLFPRDPDSVCLRDWACLAFRAPLKVTVGTVAGVVGSWCMAWPLDWGLRRFGARDSP